MGKATPWQKEWTQLNKKEIRLLKRCSREKRSVINEKLAGVVPGGLQSKLEQAFVKGFALVFEKGGIIIEKTYGKEKYQKDYQINEYAAGIRGDRKSLKRFGKKAGGARAVNLLISGAEGIGLGALGIGLPDIPLFLGIILKSIYEISLSYGFSYETDEERFFILSLIETALGQGEALYQKDLEINRLISRMQEGAYLEVNLKEQVEKTAALLSAELLYLKFLQGIPVAGIIGGISDAVYLNKITAYAMLKYQRRFLLKDAKDKEGKEGQQ